MAAIAAVLTAVAASRRTATGRYRTSTRQGSCQGFGGSDGIGVLRLQYLVQLTSALTAATKPNGCLMPVSVSSPSEGQRPLSLPSAVFHSVWNLSERWHE